MAFGPDIEKLETRKIEMINRALHRHMNEFLRSWKKLYADWESISETEQSQRMATIVAHDKEWLVFPETERREAMDFYGLRIPAKVNSTPIFPQFEQGAAF